MFVSWRKQCWDAGAARGGRLCHSLWAEHFWQNWQGLNGSCCDEVASPSVGGAGMARGGTYGGVTLGGTRSRTRPAVGGVGRA